MATKPGATNWAEQWEKDAIGRWLAEGGVLDQQRADRNTTVGQRTSDADNWMAWAQGYQPPTMTVDAWGGSTGQAGRASDALYGLGTSRAGASAAAGIRDAGALQGFDPNLRFDSTELRAFNADDVSGFDPTQYGETFARGAYGDFKLSLGDELEALQSASVGAGRFRTGLFDADQGTVVTRLGSDFNNRIAQAAVQFSGQRLDALRSGADLRFQRAAGIDGNTLRAATTSAELGLRRAEGIDSNAIRAGEARASATSQGIAQQIQALTASGNLGLGVDNNSLDAWRTKTNTQADLFKFGADLGAKVGMTGLQAAIDREGAAQRDRQFTETNAGAYTSSNPSNAMLVRDREDEREAQRRREAEQVAAQTPKFDGGIPYKAPVDPAQQLARSVGLPYKK